MQRLRVALLLIVGLCETACQLGEQPRGEEPNQKPGAVGSQSSGSRSEEWEDVLAAKLDHAEELRAQDDLEAAQALQKEALAECWEILGPEHPATLTATNNLAETLRMLGDLAAARTLLETASSVGERVQGADHPSTLTAKNNLALTLKAQGDLVGARTLLEEVVPATERALGKDHLSTVAKKANLAAILDIEGDLSRARVLYEEVLSVWVPVMGADHPDTLVIQANLAETLQEQGDLSSAQILLQEVLATRKRVLGEDHFDTLTTRATLADTLRAQGDLSGARALYEELLSIHESTHDEKLAWVSQSEMAWTLLDEEDSSGDLDPRDGLSMDEQTVIVDLPALTWKHNLAKILLSQGDLARARALQEEVVFIWEAALRKDHPDTLAAKNNLASTLLSQGDLAAARALQEEVLAAQKRLFEEDHPDLLPSKLNLAATLFAQGELAAARALQEEVVTAHQRILEEGHPDALTAKNNLAQTLNAQDDWSGARFLQEETLAVSERALGMEHPLTLNNRANLAATLYLLGELPAARQQWESILATQRRLFGEDRKPDTLRDIATLAFLSSTYRDLGEPDLAVRASFESLDALDRQTRRAGDAEELRSAFRQRYDYRYRESLDLMLSLGRSEDAFRVLQRFRARSLLQRLERQPIRGDESSAEMAAWSEVVSRRYNRLAQAVYAAETETERQRLREDLLLLRREQQKIEATIRAALPGGDLTVELADVAAARAALDPGTLLVSYLVGSEETVLIFTLTHGGPLEIHRESVEYAALSRQMMRFYSQLERRPEDLLDAGSVNRWLADRLLAPIADRIDAAERLVIVPDEVLHYLPIAALARPGTDGTARFLIEEKPLHVAASASVYERMRRGRPRHRSPDDPPSGHRRLELAAFGDPSYPKSLVESEPNPGDDEASPPDGRRPAPGTATRTVLDAMERNLISGLVPLPHSGREVRAVRDLYAAGSETIAGGEAIAFTGVDASEANLKRDAPRARVVHIAAHGLVDAERPFDSFLALTLREQLAESGAENGLLQAWELFDGDLRLDADLVVLSACETARGEYRGGEGIISLTRAFHVAGARSVAASLWTVADDSTAELMIRFHRYLLAGLPKDAALQQAQIDFIRSRPGPDGEVPEGAFSAPYHWAAFQLFGDWQ